MPTEPVISIEELVAPIGGPNPAGVNLREDTNSEFYTLRTNRVEARTLEERQTNPPDWAGVRELAVSILKNKSKDLDVIVWLIESLVRVHHFAGLRDGLIVATQSIDAFWDTMYPPFDAEDRAQRIKGFNNLCGSTSGSILPSLRLTPLVDGMMPSFSGAKDRAAPLSIFSFSQAKASGKDVTESIKVFAGTTPDVEFIARFSDVKKCIEQTDLLQKVLDQKCAAAQISPVSFTPMKNVLEEVLAAYQEIGGKRLLEPGKPELKEKTTVQKKNGSNDEPNNRRQALEDIRKIARFFENTEPHSIIGPALNRVARWGEMPLGDLLETFVPDQDHRKMFAWLGIEAEQKKIADSGGST